MARAIVLTIGGNIGSEPMTSDRWRRFRHHIEQLVHDHGFTQTAANSGIGSWEGIAEVNHVVVGVDFGDRPTSHPARVRLGVSLLADSFGQESIALIDTATERGSDLIGSDFSPYLDALVDAEVEAEQRGSALDALHARHLASINNAQAIPQGSLSELAHIEANERDELADVAETESDKAAWRNLNQ